jgi:hypothetical protein
MKSAATTPNLLIACLYLLFLYYKFKIKNLLIIYIIGSDTEEEKQQQQQQQQLPLRTVHSDSNISQSVLATPLSVLDDNNNNEDYEKKADEIIDELWRIYQDSDSWYEEARSKNGVDVVHSKSFPKWGKVFRLIVRK